MQQFCSFVLFPTVVVAVLGAPAPTQAQTQGRRVDFNRDIRPLLSNTCYKCHGPDENERKAGLRLDTAEGAFGKSDSGSPPIVAGKSTESEVYARITSSDPNEKMPPPVSGKT